MSPEEPEREQGVHPADPSERAEGGAPSWSSLGLHRYYVDRDTSVIELHGDFDPHDLEQYRRRRGMDDGASGTAAA